MHPKSTKKLRFKATKIEKGFTSEKLTSYFWVSKPLELKRHTGTVPFIAPALRKCITAILLLSETDFVHTNHLPTASKTTSYNDIT